MQDTYRFDGMESVPSPSLIFFEDLIDQLVCQFSHADTLFENGCVTRLREILAVGRAVPEFFRIGSSVVTVRICF